MATVDIQTDVEVGSVFAKDFRILRRLRSGGMGSVFIVEQVSTAKQRALKLLAPSLADHPDIRERFVREAQAASAIDSDHVVEIVCGGIDEATSTPYLVMELLRGEDLADRVERGGPMTISEVELVMSQLGHALSLAHAKGIVHRDLKPENVFLATSRRGDAVLCAKILDFGVAKLLTENASQAGTLPVGSPAYMAPEQTDAYGNITAAADVWSLGLLAFFLLVGRSYWVAGDNGSVPALLREVCFEPLEPPSERLARFNLTATLPEGFDAWFLQCVERDIGQRYATAREAIASYPREAKPPAATSERAIERNDDSQRSSQLDGVMLSSPSVPAPKTPLKRLRSAALLIVGAGVAAGSIGGLGAFAMTRQRQAPAKQTASVKQPAPPTTAAAVSVTVSSAPQADPLELFDDEPTSPPKLVRPSAAPVTAAVNQGSCKPGQALLEGGLCVDVHETTVGEYLRCVDDHKCPPLAGVVAYDGLRPDLAGRYQGLCNRDPDAPTMPVNCVDIAAAETYCGWKGLRLPTSVEWLFAARNGGHTPYPWGMEPPSAQRVNACGEECETWAFANGVFVKHLYENSDGHPKAAAPGSFPAGASSFGVQDLIGNLSEWVTTPDKNVTTARGGSYLSNRYEHFVEPTTLRRTATSHTIGFRCATK
jgi:serine/threonine-protein kinase